MVMDPEVNMENEDESRVVPIAARTRRKPAARKKAPAARKPRTAATARRKPAASARRRPARPTNLEAVIASITGGVAVARAAIAEASGQGATAVRRALGSASKASRRSITRMAHEWKSMDARKKAQVLAALLAAAAASAPLVRKTLKK
jgi:hypothetical protein